MGERQRSLSRRESLTGCFNRRAFYELFPREVERGRRLGQGLRLSSSRHRPLQGDQRPLGHETGDRVLQQLAARLRGIIRETDLLFRWGGEEFVILLPHTAPAEAPALAERIRAAVAERPFVGSELTPRVAVTVSLGVAGTAAWPTNPTRCSPAPTPPATGPRRPAATGWSAESHLARGLRPRRVEDVMNRSRRILAPAALLAALLGAPAQGRAGPSDGVLLRVDGGHLKVAFCAEDVVRVAFARDTAFFDRPSLAAGVRRCAGT